MTKKTHEEILTRQRDWDRAHHDRVIARVKRWREKYPDKWAAIQKAWRQANREKRARQARERRKTNPSPINPKDRARTKQWVKDHPEAKLASNQRRRAKQANAAINDLTAEQFEEIKTAYNYQCAYCPQGCALCRQKRHKLTQDHIQSLTNNGNHTVQNVVPCCQSCNSKKKNGPPLVPVQPLLLTMAPSRKRRN